jgi:hypothetical protein
MIPFLAYLYLGYLYIGVYFVIFLSGLAVNWSWIRWVRDRDLQKQQGYGLRLIYKLSTIWKKLMLLAFSPDFRLFGYMSNLPWLSLAICHTPGVSKTSNINTCLVPVIACLKKCVSYLD